jgi:hypothetical protein
MNLYYVQSRYEGQRKSFVIVARSAEDAIEQWNSQVPPSQRLYPEYKTEVEMIGVADPEMMLGRAISPTPWMFIS